MRAGTAEFCVLPSRGRGEKCAFSRELPFTMRGADNNLNMTLIPHWHPNSTLAARPRSPEGKEKGPGGPQEHLPELCDGGRPDSRAGAAEGPHQAAALLRVGPCGLPTAHPRAGGGSHQCGGCGKGDSQVTPSVSPEPSSEPRHVGDLDEDSRGTPAPRDDEDTEVPDTCLGASRVVSAQPTPDLQRGTGIRLILQQSSGRLSDSPEATQPRTGIKRHTPVPPTWCFLCLFLTTGDCQESLRAPESRTSRS